MSLNQHPKKKQKLPPMGGPPFLTHGRTCRLPELGASPFSTTLSAAHLIHVPSFSGHP
jgi:hypothetical protein